MRRARRRRTHLRAATCAATRVQRWFAMRPRQIPPPGRMVCQLQCRAAIKTGGEWNEHNAGCLDLQILCHHCYQDAMARSVEALDGIVPAAWIDGDAGHHALRDRQRALEQDTASPASSAGTTTSPPAP